MVGIVIATHGAIGAALLETAIDMVGFAVPGAKAIAIHADIDRATGWQILEDAVDEVDADHGTLILVDMFGGTPSTLALSLLAEREVEVLTGVNLAMVLRAILHRKKRSLAELAPDVLAYGQRNVTSSAQWLTSTPHTSE
jgi:PTS system mannose-specific IIA component